MDQFYTNDDVAIKCFKKLTMLIDIKEYDIFLEPSAGKGSFLKLFPKDKRIGIDIDPKNKEIKKMDFFDFEADEDKTYCVVGNPPFGRVSSVAIKFFNKASEFSDVIAFIIPRTFKRISVQNKLNLDFHLIYNMDLPLKPCCFTPKMSAKCCFQIWKKKDEKREIIKLKVTHKDWEFLKFGPLDDNKQPTPPLEADFAMKAYGSNCGEIIMENLENLRPKSWHWIKSNIDINELIDNFQSLDYSISKDTVRQDSIGKGEVVQLYIDKYN